VEEILYLTVVLGTPVFLLNCSVAARDAASCFAFSRGLCCLLSLKLSVEMCFDVDGEKRNENDEQWCLDDGV
jgi:hypothetical protein